MPGESPAEWPEQERLADAYSYLRRALELDFPASLHEIVRLTGGAASLIISRLGKADELADWISETTLTYPGVNLVPARPSPEALLLAQRARYTAMERGLPSLVLITQGNSGSVSIGNIFHSGFSLPTVLYSLVNLRVVSPWLEDFMRGGSCSTTHLNPTPKNLDLLLKGGVRSIIVHVRDPRQLLISGIEHGRKYANQLTPSDRLAVSGSYDKVVNGVI